MGQFSRADNLIKRQFFAVGHETKLTTEQLMPSEPEQTIPKLSALMNKGSRDDTRRTCIECGQCASRCFLAESYPDINPQQLVDQVLTGKQQELIDSEFIWTCTLCGRCTMNCPQEVSMDALVRELRGLAWNQGKAPARLVEGIETALKLGNNIGMDSEEFFDTITWLAEEAAEEMEGLPEEGLAVPFDREGADLLYIPNPRDPPPTPACSRRTSSSLRTPMLIGRSPPRCLTLPTGPITWAITKPQ